MPEENINSQLPTSEQPERVMTNNDVKEDPLFKKVKSELGALKAQVADEQKKQQEEQAAAEIERVKQTGQFDEALKKHALKLEQMEASHKAELLRRDLTTELIRAGAQNEVFIRGAVSSYNGEADIAEYVDSLASNEQHSIFFGKTESPRQTVRSPSKVTPTGGVVNWEQVRSMEKSEDPTKKSEARQLLTDYFVRHGEMPPE
jgi:hypothetical protein